MGLSIENQRKLTTVASRAARETKKLGGGAEELRAVANMLHNEADSMSSGAPTPYKPSYVDYSQDAEQAGPDPKAYAADDDF